MCDDCRTIGLWGGEVKSITTGGSIVAGWNHFGAGFVLTDHTFFVEDGIAHHIVALNFLREIDHSRHADASTVIELFYKSF